MKKRLRITPFAKIVILAVVVLIARYAYIHREEIASGEFFNLKDTVDIVSDTNKLRSDTIYVSNDSVLKDTVASDPQIPDTVSIIIEKSDDILSIKTLNKSINILLSDSVLISDTIFFNIPKDRKTVGRIIIK